MKTKLLFLPSLAFSLFCGAQNVTIPDANFKSYLVGNTSINTNKDSEIQYSEAIAYKGAIDCSSKNIKSLTGIEAFVNLTVLSCYSNQLTSLDVSNNTALKSLICSGNQLTTLDVGKNLALNVLNFHTNKIASLDVSKNTLLNSLIFSNNLIATIDLTKNTALSSLAFENNMLTDLDLTKNKLLTDLDCSSNKLKTLNLINNTALIQLSCNHNQFTDLDLTANTALLIINSVNNPLTTVDLSKNKSLSSVDFSDNLLTSLDVSNNKELETLVINNNKLTSVNINNGNNVGIAYFDVTNNLNLTCIQVDNVSEANNYTSSGSWMKDNGSSYNTNCSSSLGVSDNSKNDIKIYPNPTKSIINWSVIADMDIYSTVGQRVLVEKSVSSANLSNLPNGVYVIVLKDKDGKEIQRTKIIKN